MANPGRTDDSPGFGEQLLQLVIQKLDQQQNGWKRTCRTPPRRERLDPFELLLAMSDHLVQPDPLVLLKRWQWVAILVDGAFLQ